MLKRILVVSKTEHAKATSGQMYSTDYFLTVLVPEQRFVNGVTYQLKALGIRIYPTIVRHIYVLRSVLSASHDFPLDADEHPDPSSHKFGNFQPED
jgi:hypothetical protein